MGRLDGLGSGGADRLSSTQDERRGRPWCRQSVGPLALATIWVAQPAAAIPTTGAGRKPPPWEPRYPASPKAKMPPSDATSQ